VKIGSRRSTHRTIREKRRWEDAYDFHAAGRTYFNKNTPARVAGDFQNLGAAALCDQAVHMQNAD
jgi:hypothetical protein